MRRLLPLLALLGCDDTTPRAPAPPRVEAIAPKPLSASSADLCDAVPKNEQAPVFQFPEVEGDVPRASGPRWINVWATWCPPCVQELPVLRRIEAALKKKGAVLPLTLLSVDGSAEDVARFQSAHPEVAGTLRLKDEKQLEPWLNSLGLDRSTTLPVHLFVDPDGKLACVRTGAIHDGDEAAIRALIQ